MNARCLSGGKRTKEEIDVQQSSVPQEIYKPPPGSMFCIKFLYSHHLSADWQCFDILKRDNMLYSVTLVGKLYTSWALRPLLNLWKSFNIYKDPKMKNFVKVLSRSSKTPVFQKPEGS